MLGLRLEADRIRILTGLRLADLGERLQIENGHAVGLAVGDKSLAEFGRDRDSVHAVELRDLADHLARFDVHHFHQSAVRSVNAVGRGIHREVVPTARAADLDLADDLVSFGRERRGDNQQLPAIKNFFIILVDSFTLS